MDFERILIPYLSVGSGHEIAARAIEQALKKIGKTEVYLLDPFATISDTIPLLLDKLQLLSISLVPGLYDALWRQGTPGNLFERFAELTPLQEIIASVVEEYHPDAIIATHVLPCALAANLKERNQGIERVYGVVTDFDLHSYWPTSEIDGYFVAHNDLKNLLFYRGVNPSIVHVTGIPLRSNFERAVNKSRTLGRKNKLRVSIVAGGLRGGAYVKVRHDIINLLTELTNLSQRYRDSLSVKIILGKSVELKEKLISYQSSFAGFDVLGFTENMYEILMASDLLVCKPGGLIVAEALACGVGLILFHPGPGQERGNVHFLARHGVAMCGESPEDIARVIRMCIDDWFIVDEMKAKAYRLGKPKSAMQLAKIVLSNV
ncbi:MAG: hypothetical protein D6694_14790 [Gammaproteobacteria bacterium]|nr:MAG: hypothetical protein D6694_14790 [Gammaproteobacteria bacterium]